MERSSSGLTQDLKGLPDDLRDSARGAENKLNEVVSERPALGVALDLRVVLVSAAVALLVSLVLHLVGLGFAVSLLIFLLLFGGIWFGISRAAAPRPATHGDGEEPDEDADA